MILLLSLAAHADTETARWLYPRWIRRYNVPRYYAEVFFDDICVISFCRILEIILSEPQNFSIRKDHRNQFKSTIHVGVPHGLKWGRISVPPTHSSEGKELSAGRLLHYVKFSNGRVDLDEKVTNDVVRESLGET